MTAEDPRVEAMAEALHEASASCRRTHGLMEAHGPYAARLLAALDRGPLVVGMSGDDHKELLARLLRKGVDPTDWRIIATALAR